MTNNEFTLAGLDRIFHEKARLGILTCLVTHADGMIFGELRDLCGLTDGNLNRHLDALQNAGLVEQWKGYKGKRPQTLCRITSDGRERFRAYLQHLESIVADALAAVNPNTEKGFQTT